MLQHPLSVNLYPPRPNTMLSPPRRSYHQHSSIDRRRHPLSIPPPILPFAAVRTPPSADNLFACWTTATVSDPNLRFRSFRFRTQTHRDHCSTDISFTRRPLLAGDHSFAATH
ncbi:hypothetical protein RYX36_009938 [Vicia faba]